MEMANDCMLAEMSYASILEHERFPQHLYWWKVKMALYIWARISKSELLPDTGTEVIYGKPRVIPGLILIMRWFIQAL
jgi:hypothetical protein